MHPESLHSTIQKGEIEIFRSKFSYGSVVLDVQDTLNKDVKLVPWGLFSAASDNFIKKHHLFY